MKKSTFILISILVLGGFLLTGSGFSFAQTGRPSRSPTPTRSPKPTPIDKQERKEERAEIKESKRAEVQARVDAKRAERIRAFWAKMKHRLEIMIRRLDKMAERIQSRINKLKDLGKNVTVAQAKLDQAKVAIQKAKDMLKDGDAKVEALLTSNNPKKNFEDVRALVKEIINQIKTAHRLLVDTIKLLKGASGISPSPSASLSPLVSPSPSGSVTPTPSGTATPTPTPSGSSTPTPTPSESATPTPTPSSSETPTPTPSGTATPTPSGTTTPTP